MTAKYLKAIALRLMVLGSLAMAGAPVHAQSFPYKECHLEMGIEKPTYATMTFKINAPNCTALNWVFYAPVPPDVPGQLKPRATLTVEGSPATSQINRELSNEHRLLISSIVPVTTPQLQHELVAKVSYWTSEVPRHLVQGGKALQAGSVSDAAYYLSASDTCDFTNPTFQNWLTINQLRRQVRESDLDFAWRAFLILRSQYSYHYIPDQDRRSSNICQISATDCGGISFLFISVMRANNIPARARVGRWTNANSTDAQYHVKSEFYAQNVGWVPMELSGAITNKVGDPMKFFGQEHGDFMTLHIDPDLVVDSIWFGAIKLKLMQNPAYWVTGKGHLTGASKQIDWRAQPIAAYQ